MFHGTRLRDLDLSHCRINSSGMRAVVDAIWRNVSLRYINLSFNSMSSKNFEFSIKIAATITRQPNMLHVNLTSVGFTEEEVIFIGLANSMSKTMVSLHLTGNKLSYYNRIFLRTLLAARVDRKRQNNKSSKIKNNVEYT
jgi:uncharacterized protein YjbI with pentapeptide repeats